MLDRATIAVLSLALSPIAAAVAAMQATDQTLLNDEGIIRVFIYIGSVALGGYLVAWLTRTVWPQMLAALKEGFASIVVAIKEHEANSNNRANQIIEHVDNHTHKE